MASIFTYDPDPPKVSSPWSIPRRSKDRDHDGSYKDTSSAFDQPGLLSDYGVTKLEAEPQQGPTEYKLHLLLRPRRVYRAMSTAIQTPGSSRSRSHDTVSSDSRLLSASPAPHQSRQQRLLHLTTQLLWRLQQSSPYHASSSKEMPLPQLPGVGLKGDSSKPLDGLLPGLEESRGALYEIGVSDDGTLVGLAKDEMDESLTTLKNMASSLGCIVELLRMVVVGECEWVESDDAPPNANQLQSGSIGTIRSGKLWVAEALVTPNLGLSDKCQDKSEGSERFSAQELSASPGSMPMPSKGSSQSPQLRVTFTGPTMSGKSTLLGTLSTGTLDNGRGKSRLSLLKHRHEVLSGVTSSIAQELIGYKDQNILNFAHGNIESWTDIHDCAENGRLVFVSDCGGHPRYRRTVLRGLMSWAPHWTILCINADESDDTTGAISPGVDFAKAHLSLALNLSVPLAVVITKLDLASKASIQKTLSKILTAVKASGRTPRILHPDQKPGDSLRIIPHNDYERAHDLSRAMMQDGDFLQHIPIVITSAVKGTGIGLLHALLQSLPLPPVPTPHDFVGMALNPEQPKCLFHIDDTFSLPASYHCLATSFGALHEHGLVVSGHVRFGRISVGDEIVVGPFAPPDADTPSSACVDKGSPASHGLSISHPSSAELARLAIKSAVSASAIPGEWHTAIVASVRNLRLPVRSLESGQAGSIGLFFKADESSEVGSIQSDGSIDLRVRRGMVIAIPSKHMLDTGLKLQAASGFTATFCDYDMSFLTPGTLVNVYVASVRAAARVRRATRQVDETEEANEKPRRDNEASDADEMFVIGDDAMRESIEPTMTSSQMRTDVVLELLHSREWVELGCRVILLEGGNQYSSGLEGYVGNIVEIMD